MGKKQEHIVNILLPLGLLLTFAVSALAVLLFATGIYKSSAVNNNRNDVSRIALSYVSEKLHRFDSTGMINLESIDGVDALVLEEDVGEKRYFTLIYIYENQLMELYIKEGTEINFGQGRAVAELEDFKVERVSDKLFRISCTDTAGAVSSMLAAVKTGTEAA